MTRATTLTPFWTRLLAVLILPAMVVAFAAGCGGNSEPGNGKGANGNGAANNNDELIGGNSGNSGTNTPTGSGNVPDITVPGTDWQVDACREVGPLELTQSLHGYRLRHSGEVTRLAISPDNKWLASGSADNTVRLWQLSTGREVQMFQIGAGEIRDIAFSPDSQRILLGYTGGHVVEWHLGFRRFRWVDTGSSVTAVGYLSADMMRVGAITAEAAMEYGFPPLRNEREAGVTLGTPIRRSGDATQSQPAALPGQMRINPRSRNGALRSTMARFSADGAALAVKDDVRGALQLVSPRSSWAIRKSIPLTDEGVRAMDFTPSANRLIVAHQKSNRITIYHEEGEVLGMVRDRNVPIDALRVSRNGHELWTWGRSDHRFHRFSVDHGGERPTFGAVIPGVKAMAGSSDNRLAVGTDRGDIFVYDTASGQRLLPEDPFARITSGAISASGSHIAVGTVDSTIRVVRTSDRSQPIEPLHLAGDDAITGVGISDDGSIVMAASSTRLLVHSVVANSEQWSR